MKPFWIAAIFALTTYGQTIQSLTAQIQRAPTAALFADRGAAYLAAGDARNALADFDRALDRDALHLRALTLRAQANSRLGRHGDAITDYSGAIALAPTDAKLYAARAAAYAATGDARLAAADRDEALRLDPQASAPVTIAAPTPPPPAPAPERPKIVEAPKPATPPAPKPVPPAAAAPATSASSPANANDHYSRGKNLLDQGKIEEAIAALTEAIRLQPNNPIFFNTRGYGYYRAKDYQRAIADYDEAIRLNPEYLNATHNRSVARRAAGDIAGYNADRQREIELNRKLGN